MTFSPEEISALGLSLRAAAAATLAGLVPALALGFALARMRARWRPFLETLVNLPLVLPPVVTGYALLVFFGRRGPAGIWLESAFGFHLAFTFWAAAFASSVMAFPLMTRAIRLGFEGVDARLENASRSLGAGRVRTFMRVSLPLAWRGVAAGCALGFARALGEFGATIMFAGNIAGETRTIPLAIYSAAQRPGADAEVWKLALVSALLAFAALLCGELLNRKRGAK